MLYMARQRHEDREVTDTDEDSGLVQLFGEGDSIALDCFFVYPEELKSVARVQVFRDFLVANAQRWNF